MENAPFFDAIANGPPNGAAHWLTTADGVQIRVGHWSGDNVKGTVLLFPGRSEYIEKYGPAAQEFLRAGYATMAIDWRGQGLSGRTGVHQAMGDVGQFSDYQHDVAAMVDHARALGLPAPFHLIAHSMGGCIGLRSLNDGLAVNSVAFSGPMWGITMAWFMRPLAWGVSGVSRLLGFHQNYAPGQEAESYILREVFAVNTLTSDAEMYAFMHDQLIQHPELALGGPSLRWLNESLREMRRLSKRPAPDTPCLTFMGSEEVIVDQSRIRTRMDNWPNGRLIVLDGGRHEVMMEVPKLRNALFDQTIAHFDKHA